MPRATTRVLTMLVGAGLITAVTAQSAAGRISSLTIDGDTAHVTVIKDGLKTPTGVEPAGDTLWFTERGTGKVWSVPLPR